MLWDTPRPPNQNKSTKTNKAKRRKQTAPHTHVANKQIISPINLFINLGVYSKKIYIYLRKWISATNITALSTIDCFLFQLHAARPVEPHSYKKVVIIGACSSTMSSRNASTMACVIRSSSLAFTWCVKLNLHSPINK